MKKPLPIVLCVIMVCIGSFVQDMQHTCPIVSERIVLQYPTRNEMLEFLRQYEYKGTLDGEIGEGGNTAWGKYKKVLDREDNNKTAIELSGGVYED